MRRLSITFENNVDVSNPEIQKGTLKRVALLTAGGLAPCLSSAVAALISRYTEVDPSVEILLYKDGYKGLLLRDFVIVTADMRKNAHLLHDFGGSPIGNSRVKMTNIADCVKRGLVKEGENPQKIAAENLVKDGVEVLHTIGGDDTNTAAAELASFLKPNGYNLTVIGLPKTVDNDVYPIKQSLGAWTAAEEGAKYFKNIVAEHSANPRMLIVHEVMGRNCGWLTAATAFRYMQYYDNLQCVITPKPAMAIHGVYVPELSFDLASEADRLKSIMDNFGSVNIFVSEGAGVAQIIEQMTAAGETVPRDAFGHPKLDSINTGQWFAQQLASKIGAEKTLVQKSGYFARAAPANLKDQKLIKSCAVCAVAAAFSRQSGVMGNDEDHENKLRMIEFERIKGGKPFNTNEDWFKEVLVEIGQSRNEKA